jgi:hypothetical protein
MEPKVQRFVFILLASAIGLVIGDLLRTKKKISLTQIRKGALITILIVNIILCLIFVLLLENVLLKQILVCSLLLISSITSLLIVLAKQKANEDLSSSQL